VFRQWLLGQVVLGLTVGAATYAGLIILGDAVDPLFGHYALLLATVAGLFELLPIIGPILAAIPAVMLALTMSVQAVVAVFILYLAVQQLENYLLVPKIQGDAVRLHPSAIMFALVVGGAIAGLIGAILALPVAATARDIYRYLFGRLSDERAAQPASAEPETVPQAPAAAPAEAAAGPAWRPDATSPTDGSATPDPGAGDDQGLAGATAREHLVAAGHRPLPTPSSLIPPPDA
ncbi:MAG: AI-2E family transporter, partial [Candidatus Limnocylindrales bacterium]